MGRVRTGSWIAAWEPAAGRWRLTVAGPRGEVLIQWATFIPDSWDAPLGAPFLAMLGVHLFPGSHWEEVGDAWRVAVFPESARRREEILAAAPQRFPG